MRSMPALRSVVKIDSKWPRRALISASLRGQLVAVVAECRPGACDLLPAGVPQVAQGDDVAVAGGEVDGRVDLQRGLRGSAALRVDLDPDRPALAGRRVDHDHRRVRACA